MVTPIAIRKQVPLRDCERIVSHIDNRWYKHSRQFVRRQEQPIRNRIAKYFFGMLPMEWHKNALAMFSWEAAPRISPSHHGEPVTIVALPCETW